MRQVIEYKAAAIEQFRKGDLLQRVIDDVQSEAANAPDMKAEASGNPLTETVTRCHMQAPNLFSAGRQHS